MARPNQQILRMAWFLEHVVAELTTGTQETIVERLANASPYPSRTIGAAEATAQPTVINPDQRCFCGYRRPCVNHDGATLTSVERSAETRMRDTSALAQIVDDLATFDTMVHDYVRFLRRAAGHGVTAPEIRIPLCCDHQIGRDGVAEWGDPSCELPSTKAGLCSAHYQAARRYKLAHGIRDTTIEPAA